MFTTFILEHWTPDMGWNLPEQLAGATSRCNRGAAVEADTIGEQQLKRMQSGSSS